ncbi:hypothetical protein [Arsukibacterium sp.]
MKQLNAGGAHVQKALPIVGKEKLFVHPGLVKLMTQDTNELILY